MSPGQPGSSSPVTGNRIFLSNPTQHCKSRRDQGDSEIFMAKSPKSFPFPSPWQGNVLAEREETHQHSSEQPATTWKMPSPVRFQEEGQTWQSPGVRQQIGLCPVGHGQVLAVMPAGFGTCPGTRAKAGAPSGCIPFLMFVNHSNVV